MWYEKSESAGKWLVYRCTPMAYILVKVFKTEKGADNYIRKHS